MPRIAFIVNVDWFFLSHRLPIAKAAAANGARVRVICGDTGKADLIRAEGFEFSPIHMSRTRMQPIGELKTIWSIYRNIREFQPQLIHNVTIKPVIYGSLAARLVGSVAVVNAVTGLGHVFTAKKRGSVVHKIVSALYGLALGVRPSRTIFQNHDDRREFIDLGLVQDNQTVVIKGSGVDCGAFEARPEPPGDPVVLLASRLLWNKGIGEFVDAARALKIAGTKARFVLVGKPDSENPESVPECTLQEWDREGVIEWWGFRSDMVDVLEQAAAVVLPTTYREGIPKVLIEAAACSRPIITTDAPGCREIVRHNINGILIPPGDASALTEAISYLVGSPDLRMRFGSAGRRIVESEFSESIVVEQTLEVYQNLLGLSWPQA